MVAGRVSSRQASWGLGAGGWGLGVESRLTHDLSPVTFDFNYGVCVMRMREGLCPRGDAGTQ